jgi:hypothetical protein
MNDMPNREQLSVRPYFDRTMTLYIKGIALLCMLVHHFFTFPERYIPGIEYPYLQLFARIFQSPTRICVSTFAFLTGYFYYFSKKKTLAYSLKKDFQLLVSYWVAFICLLGLSLLGGFQFRLKDILLEMLTLKKDIMVDSWYVQFYLLAMLMLPLAVRLLPKKGPASYLVGLGVPVLLFTCLTEFAPAGIARIAQTQCQWFTSIMSGYLAAQNNLFAGCFDPVRDRFGKAWKKAAFGLALMAIAMILRRFFFFGIFGVVFLTRSITFQIYLDVIYAPIFVYGSVTFLQNVRLSRWVRTPLASIGKLSLTMWFAHGLFFGVAKELYQPIAFLPKEPIAVLVWATILTYGLAWCMDKITGFLLRKR